MLADKQTEKANNVNQQNTPAKLQVCFGGFSDSGIKEENQDAFAALVPKNNELITKGLVATIADGVSSASKAKEAANISVTQFISDYYATPETWSTQKSAAKVLTSLNQWLYSQIDSYKTGQVEQYDNQSIHQRGAFHQQTSHWLTTFSALIVKSTTGYIFHVGDTRISLYRQEKIDIITRDHNRKHGNSNAILTRALGADPRLEVDVHQIDIHAGDIYLLTCDGVHDYLANSEVDQVLKTLPAVITSNALEQASKQLVNLALMNGSQDNVSCLLLYVGSTPNRELAEIERDLLNKVIPPALKVGDKIDGYKVAKILHASIRSHLYLVEQPNEAKPAVLKVPSTNFSEDPIYLQGFKREAWLGERVDHRNIMKIKPAPINSQFLYHVCEFIEGQTLSDWIHDNPKPNLAQVRDIIEQVILALRAFKRLELVHRDLKSDNIMIDAYGKVTLIDYGTVLIASLEENSNTIKESVPQGSLNYIAPETLLELHADHQSDLYSLGVIAYEMLSGGKLPYKPMQRAEVTFKDYQEFRYLSIKQSRPDLPLWVDLALQKATKANPKERYTALSEFFADLSKPSVTAIQEYKRQPIIQRNPVQFWQGVSALLFILLMISLFG